MMQGVAQITKLSALAVLLLLSCPVAKNNLAITRKKTASNLPQPILSQFIKLEPIKNMHSTDLELDIIHQVLRLIDVQYVQKERIITLNLLQGGLAALAESYPNNFEYANTNEINLGLNNNLEKSVLLCSASSTQFNLCKNKKNKTTNSFAAKKLENDLVVRIKNRAFFVSIPAKFDSEYFEHISYPILSQLSQDSQEDLLEIIHTYLNGILAQLDPHSSYLNDAEYKELHNGTRGYFDGVGIVLNSRGNLAIVEDVIAQSPAQKAGVQIGDIVIQVEKKITLFSPVSDVVNEIRNSSKKNKTSVSFYRPSTKTILHTKLQREEIIASTITPIEIKDFEDIFFIKITGFASHTSEDLWKYFSKSQKKHKRKYMILDLRGNPGGLLDEAVEVSDLFLKHGKIVSVRSNTEDQDEYATPNRRKINLPLLVLINAGSASASEIVAGALKDQQRAIIIGERSFGKGSVQSIFDTGFGTALKMTVAHHVTPSGTSIQGTGVLPHIFTHVLREQDGVIWETGASEPQREAELPYRLDNPDFKTTNFGSENSINPNYNLQLWTYNTNVWPSELKLLENNSLDSQILINKYTDINKQDPIVRTALLLATNLKNKICLPTLETAVCIKNNEELIQLLEMQLMPQTVQKFLVEEEGNNFNYQTPLKPQKISIVNNNMIITCATETCGLPSGLLGIKITAQQNTATAWINTNNLENKIQPVALKKHQRQIPLPNSIQSFLSEQTDTASILQVLWKNNFKNKAFVLGNINYTNTKNNELAKALISIKNSNNCQNNFKNCANIKINWEIPLTIGTYTAFVTPLLAAHTTISPQSTNFSCTQNSCEPLNLTLLTTQTNTKTQGVAGIIIVDTYGNIVKKLPLLSITGEKLEIAKM